MGIDGISIWQLLLILLLVVVIFGTGKLRRVGTDMGHAIRGFKRGLRGESDDATEKSVPAKDAEKDEKAQEQVSLDKH